MPEYEAPGVYVEEMQSAGKPIVGVDISTALFVGQAGRKLLGKVTLSLTYADVQRAYDPVSSSPMAAQLRLYFMNGGKRALIVNVARPALRAYRDAFRTVDRRAERFGLVILPSLAAADEDTAAVIWAAASAFCRKRRAMLLIDGLAPWARLEAATAGLDRNRARLAAENTAFFHPRLLVDPGLTVGPAGAIAGIIARTDDARGVWKSPAGTDATVFGIAGLADEVSDARQLPANARGVNVIRRFPAGIVNWGARTLAEGEWRYIAVRRTALFIEKFVAEGLQWAVFEPNDVPLWARISGLVENFLNQLWRGGAFQGSKPEQAYFVKCDRGTMTDDDVRSGLVHVVVGFAPLKPSEFVVTTITALADRTVS